MSERIRSPLTLPSGLTWEDSFDMYEIPRYWRLWLRRYFWDHKPPRHEFVLVLRCDACGILLSQHRHDVTHLRHLMQWLMDEAPGDAWGSDAAVTAWLALDPTEVSP